MHFIITCRKPGEQTFAPYLEAENWFKTTEEAGRFFQKVSVANPSYHFKMEKVEPIGGEE